jgi:hypothetical protein
MSLADEISELFVGFWTLGSKLSVYNQAFLCPWARSSTILAQDGSDIYLLNSIGDC